MTMKRLKNMARFQLYITYEKQLFGNINRSIYQQCMIRIEIMSINQYMCKFYIVYQKSITIKQKHQDVFVSMLHDAHCSQICRGEVT